MSDATSIPRRLIAKPPPIDLSAIPVSPGLTSNRIQLWPALRIAPEAVTPSSPTPRDEDGLSGEIGLSPGTRGIDQNSGWGGLPSHLLELIFASLRDSQGRWPSRKVLFSIVGVCKLWRHVGHTLFFSNMWQNHTDVIVHPSQLFTLCPHPLRLQSSDHLLRCFVQRTPCSSGGISPRLGRLWRFTMYLGSDHGGGRLNPGSPDGGQMARPQLLMSARQTSRRSYQLLLSPASGPGPGGGGGRGGGRGRGGGSGQHDSGMVAVLRSNLRCSHYQLLPASSCPWARRLIAVAGYIPPVCGPPAPLISLEYRLRVRGIMLPRRMKVQVPVPHSLQRVVHNPLYDMHDSLLRDLPSPQQQQAGYGAAAALAAGGGGPAAVMAPPPPAPPPLPPPAPLQGAAGAVGAGAGAEALLGAGGVFGEGGEGLMDNLEDILEAAMRTEPLLFADMVDAAAVRPADEDDAGGGDADAFGDRRSGPAALLRSTTLALGSLFLRGFLQSPRRHGFGAGGAAAAAGGGGVGGGGFVQWWEPASPGGGAGGGSGLEGDGGGGAAASGSISPGGWSSPAPAAAPLVRFQNKAPHWNDALMCWCLNFRGRVKMASVKNFQLMCSADAAGRCVMQFGKVEDGLYILDFNPCVLTAAQAFAAALSTFETKYLL